MPMTEGGSPLPLSGYTTNWPIEMFMGYTIEDLIQKFGYRIQNAIRTPRYCGKTGLDGQTMKNKTKWWKFWNNDIRKDYKWYTGQVYNDEDIKFSNYINNPNPTVPPSEVFPTLAPEHHKKSAVKKKRKPKLHKHTFELDGGPCLKCRKTVAEIIDEDITNYNKKHGKSI